MNDKTYEMNLPVGLPDYVAFVNAVNMGIDSHLSAVTESSWEYDIDYTPGQRMYVKLSQHDLGVILRRLYLYGTQIIDGEDLFSGIMYSLLPEDEDFHVVERDNGQWVVITSRGEQDYGLFHLLEIKREMD